MHRKNEEASKQGLITVIRHEHHTTYCKGVVKIPCDRNAAIILSYTFFLL